VTGRFAQEPKQLLPPGRILQELLFATGRTQADLAGLSTKHLNQLATGKVPVSVDVARKLAKETGVPARLWLALEASWALRDPEA
jgi:HTH-type transcriptional regulator/antitoxin HigA